MLHDNGEETGRSRIDCPKDYKSIIKSINEIVKKIELNIGKEVPIGVCHPGIHSIHTGLIKNSPNCDWINNKPFQKDLREAIGREIFCENDANCFTLSEAIDGSGKHYKIVFGIIEQSNVFMEIHDIQGRLIAEKSMLNLDAGVHEFIWDGSDEPSGIYLIRVKINDKTKKFRTMLIK